MKNITFIIVAFFFTINAFSQDLIIFRTGNEVKAKVIEILPYIVKYKKYENLTGPTYSIEKNEIFMIKYENGTKDLFKDSDERRVEKQKLEADVNIDTVQLSVGFAKSPAIERKYFKEGDFTLLIGTGIASPMMGDGLSFSLEIPPIFTIGEYAVNKKISFGAIAGYAKYYDWPDRAEDPISGTPYDFQISNYFFDGRFGYHYFSKRKIDTYFGFILGYDAKNANSYRSIGDYEDSEKFYSYAEEYKDELIWGAFLGIRFFFSKNISFFTEVGYPDICLLKGGFAFRFIAKEE